MKYPIIVCLLIWGSIPILGQVSKPNCDVFLLRPLLDSVKVVFEGPSAMACVLPEEQRLWLEGLKANNERWLIQQGLLDSVEIILDNQTIFKGQLIDFYQIEDKRFLLRHQWYFNKIQKNFVLLLMVNYSRRHSKIGILPLCVPTSIVIYSPMTETPYLTWGWDYLSVMATNLTECLFLSYQKYSLFQSLQKRELKKEFKIQKK